MDKSFIIMLIWTIVLVTSFAGIGILFKLIIGVKDEISGWGMEAALGIAILLFYGGLLASLSAVSLYTEVAALGVGLIGVYTKIRKYKFDLPKPNILWLIWILPIITIISSINWTKEIDPNDDLISYFSFPKNLLESGTLIEPFSFQRAGTMGGHAFLQSFALIAGSVENLHLIDRGIASFIFFAMLWHYSKSLTIQQRAIILIGASLIPVPRISTSSGMTGGILLATLLIILLDEKLLKETFYKRIVVLGILLAGMAAIKPTFAIIGGGIIAVGYLVKSSKKKVNTPFKQRIAIIAGAYLVTLLLLTPWMIILTKSNGAPLIPPMSGNVSTDFQIYNFGSKLIDITEAIGYFFTPEILIIIAIIISSTYKELRSSSIAITIILLTFIIIVKFTALAFLDQYRYTYPLLFTSACIIAVNQLNKNKSIFNISHNNTITAVIALWVIIGFKDGANYKKREVIFVGVEATSKQYLISTEEEKFYTDIQKKIPANEKVITTVDDGFCLNYKKNTIYGLNFLGSCSPPPHLRLDGKNSMSAEEFRKYMVKLGVNYLLTVDFNNSRLLYTKRLWNNPRPEWFYKELWAPKFLHYMDIVEELEKTRTVAQEGNLKLIKLND